MRHKILAIPGWHTIRCMPPGVVHFACIHYVLYNMFVTLFI